MSIVAMAPCSWAIFWPSVIVSTSFSARSRAGRDVGCQALDSDIRGTSSTGVAGAPNLSIVAHGYGDLGGAPDERERRPAARPGATSTRGDDRRALRSGGQRDRLAGRRAA